MAKRRKSSKKPIKLDEEQQAVQELFDEFNNYMALNHEKIDYDGLYDDEFKWFSDGFVSQMYPQNSRLFQYQTLLIVFGYVESIIDYASEYFLYRGRIPKYFPSQVGYTVRFLVELIAASIKNNLMDLPHKEKVDWDGLHFRSYFQAVLSLCVSVAKLVLVEDTSVKRGPFHIGKTKVGLPKFRLMRETLGSVALLLYEEKAKFTKRFFLAMLCSLYTRKFDLDLLKEGIKREISEMLREYDGHNDEEVREILGEVPGIESTKLNSSGVLPKLQRAILKVLKFNAMTADELQEVLSKNHDCCNRGRMYRDGINPLTAKQRILNDKKVGGYYRPDFPPGTD